MFVKELEVDDSAKFVSLNVQLSQENNFMLLTPSEADMSIQKQQELTEKMKQNENSNVFVAEQDDKLVGFIGVTRGMFKKNNHVCHFAVGVLEAYQRKNIATNLINAMEKWAVNNAIIRIELSVITNNHPAIALYDKLGYKVEGLKTASIRVNNHTYNELLMYKLKT